MNRFCRIFDTPVSQVLVRIGINDDDDKSSLFVSCTLNGMYIEAVITLEQDDETYALAKLDEFNEATALNFVYQMQGWSWRRAHIRRHRAERRIRAVREAALTSILSPTPNTRYARKARRSRHLRER